jgi:hypothetical protein
MRGKLLTAAAAAASTACLSVAVVGLATTPAAGPLTATASAAELPRFTDCEALRRWYVDTALPLVGPYGLGGVVGPMMLGDLDIPANVRALSAASAGSDVGGADRDTAVSSSDTGTTVQEAGVDEADLVKTDGTILVEVRDQLLVVFDVTGPSPSELGRLRLPRVLSGAELLFDGDTALVVGSGRSVLPYAGGRVAAPYWPMAAATRLLQVSLADPAHPTLVSDAEIEGQVLSAREHDGTVRVVVSSPPRIPFTNPWWDDTSPSFSRGDDEKATIENRLLVRESELDDWLPSVRVDGGPRRPLVGCGDVRHPRVPSGPGTVTVLTLPGGVLADREATAVTAETGVVYSSADRLYVATQRDGMGAAGPMGLVEEPTASSALTDVHAFALDGDRTTYVASGTVRGAVRDRWSLDEHNGILRVATGFGAAWDPTDNGVVVLDEQGDRLRQVGALRGLGKDERITSVRWFDDLAVLVTFRQMDPLYTVDLSDPTSPAVRGELKIPGFSSYLHPLGDDLLLGVGEHATDKGEPLGGQAAVFDLSDLADPARVSWLGLGRRTVPDAGSDPRTFTYLPDRRVALLTVTDQWSGRTRLVTLRVAADGALTHLATRPVAGWADRIRALPLPDGRVALVDASGVTLLRV